MKERIADVLQRDPSDEPITIEGWVRTKRDSKNVCFLEVNDGSSLKGIQIVFDKNTFPISTLNNVTTGAGHSKECFACGGRPESNWPQEPLIW